MDAFSRALKENEHEDLLTPVLAGKLIDWRITESPRVAAAVAAGAATPDTAGTHQWFGEGGGARRRSASPMARTLEEQEEETSPPASKERFMTRYSKRIARRRVRSRCLRRDDYNTPPFAEKLKLVRADRGARCGGLRRAAAGCGGLRRAAASCGEYAQADFFLGRLD